MEMVKLAPGLKRVSRLAFGSLTVSPLQAAPPHDRAAEIIAYAFDRGINFIDTAQYYENYNIIRDALRLSGRADDIVISSKTYAYSAQGATEAVEQARRMTGRDVIDIFMLHEQESYETLRGHMEALEYLFECKRRGIIRCVGVSMHRISAVKGVMKLAEQGIKLDVIHPIYNISGAGIVDGTREEMADAVKSAHDSGIGVFGMKALAGGHLCSSADDAFDFVLDSGFIDCIAVGMQSEAEIDANIEYFESRVFSPDAKRKLAVRDRRLHIEDYCEGCGKCVDRCPAGALELVRAEHDTQSSENSEAEYIHKYEYMARVDEEKCVLCGYCSGVCPAFAVKVY